MPLTPEERAIVNRANARKSTGPRTPAGKARSRMNAFRHGLTGQHMVLHPEDDIAYRAHAVKTLLAYQPVGPEEHQLVQLLSDNLWLLQHAQALEINARALEAIPRDNESGERSWDSLSVTCADHAVHCRSPLDAQGRISAGKPVAQGSLEWLGRHRSRLERAYFKLRSELRVIQSRRIQLDEQTRSEMNKRGHAYDPALHGSGRSSPDLTGSPSFAFYTQPQPTLAYSPAHLRMLLDRFEDNDRGTRQAPRRVVLHFVNDQGESWYDTESDEFRMHLLGDSPDDPADPNGPPNEADEPNAKPTEANPSPSASMRPQSLQVIKRKRLNPPDPPTTPAPGSPPKPL